MTRLFHKNKTVSLTVSAEVLGFKKSPAGNDMLVYSAYASFGVGAKHNDFLAQLERMTERMTNEQLACPQYEIRVRPMIRGEVKGKSVTKNFNTINEYKDYLLKKQLIHQQVSGLHL